MTSGISGALRRLTPEFFRFAVVGGAATLVHATVYAVLVDWTALHPQIANVAGFASALGISLLGHHHFTFRAAAGKRELAASGWRLVVTAMAGYLLNALFVHLVAGVMAADPRLALIPMVGITPFATYLINRSWVFYGDGGAAGGAPSEPGERNLGAAVAAAAFSTAVGLTVFMLFGGAIMIDPGRTSWLMHQDPSQHYMGWAFFRHAPLIQFPLGANPLFGDAIANSIVFSDSIPLIAIPLRLVSPLLPQTFQYFGIWIAVCLCMQAFFSFRILRQLNVPIEAAGLGATLFVLSPVLLWRLHGHEALLAHWLLLAAVSLSLEAKRRDGAWLLLMLAAVLVHAYLFVMVGGVWFADLVGRWLRWHGDERPRLSSVAVPILLCPLVMWAVGYFMEPPQTGLTAHDAGYGFHRAELQTFFDSDGLWSRLLPDITDGVGGDAGFAFLGLGPCLLLVLALAVAIGRRRLPLLPQRYLALCLIAVVFAAFAVSNNIAMADVTLVSIPTPALLDPLLVSLRASGRFVWLSAYLILVLLVVFVARWGGRRTGAAILTVAVFVQIVDLQPAMAFFHKKLAAPWQNPAQSPFWTEALRTYRRIALAPADFERPIYLPMAMLAAEKGVAINVAYLARHDQAALAAEQATVLAAVESGELDPRTLYVFSDDALFAKALAAKPATALAAKVDGFAVVAPQWTGCTTACGAIPAAR